MAGCYGNVVLKCNSVTEKPTLAQGWAFSTSHCHDNHLRGYLYTIQLPKTLFHLGSLGRDAGIEIVGCHGTPHKPVASLGFMLRLYFRKNEVFFTRKRLYFHFVSKNEVFLQD